MAHGLMSSLTSERGSGNSETDLIAHPIITQKWIPHILCGQKRWKVFSGSWNKTANKIIYRQEPEVLTGENIAVIGSTDWSNYALKIDFKIITESIKPPEGGAILYYNFRNMKNYYSLHFCHAKQTIEIIKRFRGEWKTIAEQDFNIETHKDNNVRINTAAGIHTFMINGAHALEIKDEDISKGCIGLGIKYCDAAFSRVTAAFRQAIK